ncbi:MAG: hypothetical protein QOJ59_276 [Thermomicrobiales bacterium]|jgi:hypothetical protein|nr:hypothetical protein [Thermomicrobiales bacterium]
MVAVRKTVKVTPESTVDELLHDADAEPVLLEKNGAVYRLSREDAKGDVWAGYEPDPDAIDHMLDEVAGSWRDLDVDKMIADIYESREMGTRPIDRPRWPTF